MTDNCRTCKVELGYNRLSGRKTINRYEIIEEIGRGAYSKVKLAQDTETGEKVVIKIIRRSSRKHHAVRTAPAILKEVNILKAVCHDNIITLHEVIDDPECAKVYLILEYVEIGNVPWRTKGIPHVCNYERMRVERDMHNKAARSDKSPDPSYGDTVAYNQPEEHFAYVPCITLDQARCILRETVRGLECLHQHGIVHGDIKPENLLLAADYRVMVSDFDASLVRPPRGEGAAGGTAGLGMYAFDFEHEMLRTVGTPGFIAPELCCIGQETVRPGLFEQVDVWSLGVTLYCLVYARLPFVANGKFQLFQKMAVEDAYIPRRRLRPVAPPARLAMSTAYQYRKEGDIEFEDVDDLLVDLLRQMLHRSPVQRIRLENMKYHPWLTTGRRSLNVNEISLQEESIADESSIGFPAFCAVCENQITGLSAGQLYCSELCRDSDSTHPLQSKAFLGSRYRESKPFSYLASFMRGAALQWSGDAAM